MRVEQVAQMSSCAFTCWLKLPAATSSMRRKTNLIEVGVFMMVWFWLISY
ncbi:MAG: hypothetical protein IKH15_09620 [Bacteroidales bacterium]|nr:hypothetical protein [Bacteroidales bacterium]